MGVYLQIRIVNACKGPGLLAAMLCTLVAIGLTQHADAELILRGGGLPLEEGVGLTLLEEGGSFGLDNLATKAFSTPTAVDELGFGGRHLISHLNDGRYGNSWSWISDGGFNAHGVAFAGISFGPELVPNLNSFAFGRDNRGVFWDRSFPAVYTLQYTQVPNPHTNLDLPDDTTVPGTTAATGWITIGTIKYSRQWPPVGSGGEDFNTPALRHRYSFDTVDATGLRLAMPSPIDCCAGGPIGGGRPAIDEIEVYGAAFRNLDFEEAVVTVASEDPIRTIPSAAALPHWTHNNFDPDEILFDSTCLGAGCISIHDERSEFPSANVTPLQGEYSVLLHGPAESGVGPLYIRQRGLIPSNTPLFQMLAAIDTESLEVMLDGHVLSQIATRQVSEQVVELTYDVADFSGSLATLQIGSNADFETIVVVDALRFVPEPNGLVVLALGGCAIIMMCHRRKRSRVPPAESSKN